VLTVFTYRPFFAGRIMRAFRPIFFVYLCFTTSVLIGQSAETENQLQEVYASAEQQFKEGSYKQAMLEYTRLINSGFENDAVWVKRGLAHYYLKEYSEAKNDFDQGYKKMIRTPELLGFRALTLYHLEDHQAALTGFEQAFSAGFNNKEAAFLAGNLYFERSDYTQATVMYQKAVSAGSEDPVLFNNLGKALSLSGKKSEALTWLTKALSLDDSYTKARQNRANIQFDLKNWEGSKEDYSILLQQNAMDPDDYAKLGLSLFMGKEYSDAALHLENGLKRQSTVPGLYRALGLSYANAGDDRTDKAISTLEVSLEKEGEDKTVFETLAKLYFSKKKYSSSIKYAEDAQKAGSTEPSLLTMAGISWYHQGDHEKAYSSLIKMSADAAMPEAYAILGQLHFDKNNFSEAVTALNKVTNLKEDASLLTQQAKAYISLKQYKEAQSNLDAAKMMEPENVELLGMSARNNMILNQYQQAEDDLERAIVLDKSSFEINYLYGEVLLMNKNYDKAIEFLTRAVSISADPNAQAMLGMAHFKLSQYTEAYGVLSKSKATLSAEGKHDLAVSAMETGAYEEAILVSQEALAAGVDESRLWKARGVSYFHTGESALAKKDLIRALKIAPEDYRIPSALGAITYAEEDYTSAISYLTTALTLKDPSKETLLLRGRAYSGIADYSRAINDFSQILENNTDHDKARYYRGEAYFLLNKYTPASEDLLLVNNKSLDLPVNEMVALSYVNLSHARSLEFAEKAISLNTLKGEIFLEAGILQANTKDWTKAVARLNKAEELGIKDTRLKETRGESFYYLEKFDSALPDLEVSGENKKLIGLSYYKLKQYSKAIPALSSVTEPETETLVALGDSYYRENQWENAEKIFDKLIAQNQADAQVYRHLGMVYAASGRPEKAKTDFTKSLETEPENVATIEELASVHAQLNEFDQVITLYEKTRTLSGFSAKMIEVSGTAYYQLQQYSKAKPLLEEVARTGNASANLHASLGHIHYLDGEFDPAVSSLSRAIQEDPENGPWRKWRGLALFAQKKFKEASTELTKAISLGMEEADLYYSAGISLYETGDSESTVHNLTKAIDLKYSEPDAWYYRGNAYYKLKKFPEAVTDYDAAIDKGMQDPVLWNNRGKALAEQNMIEEAIDSYSQALVLDASYLRALENRGEALFQLERYPEAAQDLQNVINLKEEEDGHVRYMLAETYYMMEEYRKAVIYYSEAIRQGKASAEVYFKRGRSYAQIDDLGSALSDLNEAFNGGKKDAALFLERANVHIGLENSRAAMADLNEAIAREDSNADAYFNRGYLHELNENFSEAIADYSQAIKINPDDAIAQYSLANSLVSQGNVGGALTPIDKAIHLDPENGTYHKVKGNILYRIENTDEACKSWQKAVDLGDIKAEYYIGEYCD
jgi:tetratricopeptide (TPR) repeat protein